MGLIVTNDIDNMEKLIYKNSLLLFNKMSLARKSSVDLALLQVEVYKKPEKYIELVIHDDDISKKLDDLLSDNHWGLSKLFTEALPKYFEQISKKVDIAWNNKIQHLDFKDAIPKVDESITIQDLKEGKYIGIKSKQKNKIQTEKRYAERLEFWLSNFEFFKQFNKKDSLQWIIDHNRQLLHDILFHHNKQRNVLNSINKDLKSLIRIIKLLLDEKNELRMKFSALQMGLSDVEKMSEDDNQIISSREFRTFVPYEVLFDIVEKMEDDYLKKVNKLYENAESSAKYKNITSLYSSTEEDGKKHGNEIFKSHQIILAIALNIWNFPSRSENFTMDFIEKEEDVKECKNYVLVRENEICKLIYNEEIKKHDPITYTLDSTAIRMLNRKLCLLLKYSKRTYPRVPLFIKMIDWPVRTNPVKSAAVSLWLREVVKNKNIGVNTFRSAFVSYYLPKFSNANKQTLAARMRSSIDVITRSYFKQYQLPDVLVQVKPEPDFQLVMNASAGHNQATGLIIDDNDIQEADDSQLRQVPNAVYNYSRQFMSNIQPADGNLIEKEMINIQDRRKKNFKKWYENESNKEKKRLISKDPSTYAKRYVRELNSGSRIYERTSVATIEKYKIKVNADGLYYIEE